MEQKLRKALTDVAEEYNFSDEVRMKSKNSSNKRKRWHLQVRYYVAAVSLIIGILFVASPDVRSMTEEWTTQVFHIDISSKKDFEIREGYVYVDGVKTVKEEEYKLALYSPVYTDEGYVLQEKNHKEIVMQNFTEDHLGQKFSTIKDAMKHVDYHIKQPTVLPEYLSLNKIYVNKDQATHFSFKSDSNKDLSINVEERSAKEGYLILDDVEKIDIGGNGRIGKTPNKYWDTDSNKPAVNAEYALTFIDHGVQYELFGTNLTKEELIEIAKAMK
ncbi:DUF4367 domain-containing protein [Guptibacillus hwajinpoensis]|uniref:DUF4367 domain-containing protein n=1 Tax=Guptibacillus hwajinpoensis TaxID=208199 RepID=UPI003735ECDE